MTALWQDLKPGTFRYWRRCNHRKRWLHAPLSIYDCPVNFIRISQLTHNSSITKSLSLWQHTLLVIDQVPDSPVILRFRRFLNALLRRDPINILANHHLNFLISIIKSAFDQGCRCEPFCLGSSYHILVAKETTCKDLICTYY